MSTNPIPPLNERHQRLLEVARSQPGSKPYLNRRPIRVTGPLSGKPLLEVLQTIYPYAPPSDWREISEAKLLEVNGIAANLTRPVHCGEKVERLVPNTTEPEINPEIDLLFEDSDLILLNKPAPLPIHPCGRYNKHSLTGLAKIAWPELYLRPAHRIDADTTGLVVFTKHRKAAGKVQLQFEKQQVDKTYLTRVEGIPTRSTFKVQRPITFKADRLGLRRSCPTGQPAKTTFRVLATCSDGTSIIEAKPITGRTNQIRIHLQTEGYPIVGDGAYGSTLDLNRGFTSESMRLHLHAWKVAFVHPSTNSLVEFETPLPTWALHLP